jgi:hypothetical protein
MTSAKNAYQLGNYTKALKLWKFAVAKGDAKAITNVAGPFQMGNLQGQPSCTGRAEGDMVQKMESVG